MSQKLKITGSLYGTSFHIKTPNQYAMGIAIKILEFLDEYPQVSVKNTGWKNGFELEVASWIPIEAESIVAELQTDGEYLVIRRVSGSYSEFELLCLAVCKFLDDENFTNI